MHAGGGCAGLLEVLEPSAYRQVEATANSIGNTRVTPEEELYVLPKNVLDRLRFPLEYRRPMVLGDQARDWFIDITDEVIFPYDCNYSAAASECSAPLLKALWNYRTNLSNNLMFGGQTKVEAGL